MARLAHQAAVEAEGVSADVVSVDAFPELARRQRVTSVPSVVVDGARTLVGSITAEALLEALSNL